MHPPNGPLIVREQRGTTVRLAAIGEFDLATAPQLDGYCAEAVRDGAQLIVLDLSGVTFIDCSGVHALLAAHAQHPESLRVLVNPVVARMIDMAGIRHRLPIVEG
jgi:anti-anti-sigma factor